MKNLRKIIVAIIASCILIMPAASTAYAADMFSSENISAVLQQFGLDLTSPEGIQEAINTIRDGGLSGILNLMGIDVSEILDELQKYLVAIEIPTTQPPETTTEEEPTTMAEETTTEVPTTARPAPAPSYQYTPPLSTLPPETTTFQYIPPEQIYTEAFTTTVFNPVVEDDNGSVINESSPVKTAIGVILLLASGIGVIIVVLTLKRNRI